MNAERRRAEGTERRRDDIAVDPKCRSLDVFNLILETVKERIWIGPPMAPETKVCQRSRGHSVLLLPK